MWLPTCNASLPATDASKKTKDENIKGNLEDAVHNTTLLDASVRSQNLDVNYGLVEVPAPGMRPVQKSKECACDQRAERRANARG